MDWHKIHADVLAERDRLDEVLAVIQTMIKGGGKRRGRPPEWLKAAHLAGVTELTDELRVKPRGRPKGSKNKTARKAA